MLAQELIAHRDFSELDHQHGVAYEIEAGLKLRPSTSFMSHAMQIANRTIELLEVSQQH